MAQIRKKTSLRSANNNLKSSPISKDITSFSPSSEPDLTPKQHRAIEKRLVSIKKQINWLTNIKNTLEYQLAHDKDEEEL